jgi:hypothetical protein
MSDIVRSHGPQNFAIPQHLALNVLKRETSAKIGVKAERHTAGWSTDYRRKILTG